MKEVSVLSVIVSIHCLLFQGILYAFKMPATIVNVSVKSIMMSSRATRKFIIWCPDLSESRL